jgi:hypothetical protein
MCSSTTSQPRSQKPNRSAPRSRVRSRGAERRLLLDYRRSDRRPFGTVAASEGVAPPRGSPARARSPVSTPMIECGVDRGVVPHRHRIVKLTATSEKGMKRSKQSHCRDRARQPNRVLDDHRRKAMAAVRDFSHRDSATGGLASEPPVILTKASSENRHFTLGRDCLACFDRMPPGSFG